MANYYSMGRTNFFAVKDPEAFSEEVTPLVDSNGGNVIRENRNGVDGFILLFPDGLPSEYYPDDVEEDPIELDWVQVISKHLADDHVCVIQEIGNEKLRYLTGYSVAFNNKGEQQYVSLRHIYDMTKELGTYITEAEY